MMMAQDFLTTDEAATYLRLSERKLYDLVARSAVPCTKVTGRWLFPKAALDHWIAAGLEGAGHVAAARPRIVGGSHDPLLESALRESGCGLASLAEGSEAGLRRLVSGDVSLAAIHLHRVEGDDDRANIEAVASLPGLHDAVVIAFARREQGLLVAPGNPLGLSDLAGVIAKRTRMAQRPPGAGAQLLLVALMAREKAPFDVLVTREGVCPTGSDLGQAIRSGEADCGIASRSVATALGLGFVPLVWERFDLVLRQRDYFLPAQQDLFAFMRGDSFRRTAAQMEGYDLSETGIVRAVN